MQNYDFLIVGAGMFGSVCARKLTDAGYKVLVIDKREHIGGNCYTETKNGIHVHVYGAHIFHTSNKSIWQDIQKYAEFTPFNYKPVVDYKGNLYSFPINLMTLYQIYGIKTPAEAKKFLESEKIKIEKPSNLEEHVLSLVGEKIYKTFIYGYTKKQWGKEPKELPASIIKRIPIRTNFDDSYFFDKYQGIPVGGYTEIFISLLKDIETRLNTDYFQNRYFFDSLASKIIYTGKIDEFYDYKFGELEYRSLRFEHKELETDDYQGTAVINYTDEDIPYTRTTEHKHFELKEQKGTIVSFEYPEKYDRDKIPLYPIGDDTNMRLYQLYKEETKKENKIIFGGRLAEYKYYDMHQVWASACKTAEKLINKI